MRHGAQHPDLPAHEPHLFLGVGDVRGLPLLGGRAHQPQHEARRQGSQPQQAAEHLRGAADGGDAAENSGYNVQLLEFIDMEHTPKNILIRAVKARNAAKNGTNISEAEELISALKISPTIKKLL